MAITGPSPYLAATVASITVDLPLKLPISTITPRAGVHEARMPRKRASLSARKPGMFRGRREALSITCGRSAGNRFVGLTSAKLLRKLAGTRIAQRQQTQSGLD